MSKAVAKTVRRTVPTEVIIAGYGACIAFTIFYFCPLSL